MHDEDLTDLAMIAACHNRLFSRARTRGGAETATAVLDISCDSMTALCAALDVDGREVMRQATAILAASRAAQQTTAH